MSDNTILGKIDVIFKADGSKHCYGWKIVKKDAGWVSAEQFTQAYLEKGWVLG